jgi:hypothetical protein
LAEVRGAVAEGLGRRRDVLDQTFAYHKNSLIDIKPREVRRKLYWSFWMDSTSCLDCESVRNLG